MSGHKLVLGALCCRGSKSHSDWRYLFKTITLPFVPAEGMTMRFVTGDPESPTTDVDVVELTWDVKAGRFESLDQTIHIEDAETLLDAGFTEDPVGFGLPGLTVVPPPRRRKKPKK